MVTIVKHEWHQVDSQFALEIDESILSEIYPDLDEDEIAEKLKQIEEGEIDVEEIVNDAWENDVELEWDRQYDDWWTDRKGGYEVTYELGDEDSWHTPPKDPEPTHKCTKCKWEGQSYQTTTEYLREDGSVIEDYFNNEEESHSEKDVCPMCSSDTELTEVGLKEKQERAEREARWAEEETEDDTIPQAELEEALEELKREFEELMTHTIQCTECGWSGIEKDCYKEGICPECAAHTEEIGREDE
jgi:predicted Zn-ribbon and HTH transcriptional regulator